MKRPWPCVMGMAVGVLAPSAMVVAAPSYGVMKIGSATDPDARLHMEFNFYLNDLGQVAGTYSPASSPATRRGFRTQANAPFNPAADDIGPSIAGSQSAISGMNNLGEVIGIADGGGYFRTDASGKLNAATQYFGNSLGPYFVNDRGQIAGFAEPSGLLVRTAPNQPYNPATDNLGNYDVIDLNNRGQVLGYDGVANLDFRTDPDGSVNVATGGLGVGFRAAAINDLGQVFGGYQLGNGGNHAFVTAPNQPFPNGTDLGSLGGLRVGGGDINNRGEVVGWSDSTGGQVAFVTVDNLMTDLNTLVDPTLGLHFTNALRINDLGQILASTQTPTNAGAIYLLTPTPVPEPGAAAVILLFAAPVLSRRRHGSS